MTRSNPCESGARQQRAFTIPGLLAELAAKGVTLRVDEEGEIKIKGAALLTVHERGMLNSVRSQLKEYLLSRQSEVTLAPADTAPAPAAAPAADGYTGYARRVLGAADCDAIVPLDTNAIAGIENTIREIKSGKYGKGITHIGSIRL